MAERPVVLVTGSAGLIGTRTVEVLSPDYRVIGLDVRRPAALVPGTDFVACDLSDGDSTERALASLTRKRVERIASVVHLAAYYDFSGEPSPLYEQLTVRGTERLLTGLQAHAVEQFVFSSTFLVHRPAQPGELLTEDSPVEPTWDYPQSKVDAEAVIARARGAIPSVILRLAGVYTDDCRSIPVAQQIARIHRMEIESYLFPGDPTRGQAFVHLDDAVDCIRRAVDRRGALGAEECFLVAEPDVMSYAELQDRIGELLHGKKWPTVRIPKVVARTGAWVDEKLGGASFVKPWMIDLADAHYAVDISRARARLGWDPQHRLL
ncbi:MAG: NAD-dependent epimerase/dehydratase family protein, partial [Myxococcota bacterium]